MFNAPVVFTNVPDIAKIYELNDKQIGELENAVTQLDSDIFFETMSEERTSRWEKMLGIVPLDGCSLEDRRLKVHSKIIEKLPYTHRTLKKRLDALCGENNYTLENGYNSMYLQTYFKSKYQITDIKEMLEQMLPLNIFLTYINTMLYTECIALSRSEEVFLESICLNTVLQEKLREKLGCLLNTKYIYPNEKFEIAVIMKKNDWYLDGALLLDGEKMLNAEVKKEVL